MEHSDAAKRLKLSDGSDEDRLSALPDDILIGVLVKLRSATAVAARTSVLSRRWRGLWAFLPELHFPVGTEPHHIRSSLTAHKAPTIRSLAVHLRDADPESVATWLPIAAPRLSGDLIITHCSLEAVKRGAVELPCIERATTIRLNLHDFGLTLPPSGVFGRLTDLRLVAVSLHGPCRLGDIVSSPRCPSLRKLFLRDVGVLGNIVVHSESLLQIEMDNVGLHNSGGGIVNICSESLLQIELKDLILLRQLTIVAPALKVLKESCYMVFDVNPSKPVAKISAPQLMSLEWKYYRGPRSVQFDKMAHLFWLYAGPFLVYGSDDECFLHNRFGLLQRFEFIFCLYLTLVYRKVSLFFCELSYFIVVICYQVNRLHGKLRVRLKEYAN
ncbi:hypothetical protein ACQ4PT_070946 [Festuca glaucescens]